MVLVAGADVAAAEAGDDGAVDRPDQAAAAALDRARRQRHRAGRGELRGDLALDRGDVAVELFLVVADLLAAPRRARRGRETSACWWLCREARALASASSSAAIASRAASIRFLAVAQAVDDPLHLVAQVAHAADHGLVHPVQAVEVFGAGGEVVDAAGADDDAEQSGLPVSYIATSRSRRATSARLSRARSSSSRSLATSSSATAWSSSACLASSRAADRCLAGADRRDLAGEPVDLVARNGRSSWSARPCFSRTSSSFDCLASSLDCRSCGRRRAGEEQRA